MAITKTISYKGETREIKISGSVGSEFELYVKQGSNYYNWDTDEFQTLEKILIFQEIPSSGVYTKSVIIPEVTANTSYDFYVRPLIGTNLNVSTTHAQKIGILFQKGVSTATFTTTSAASLVIASGLTGGTITDTSTTLTQSGTITKSGSPLIYVHETPSWNIDDGGNWTLSNTVVTFVVSKSGTSVLLDDATGVASGYAVVGRNIIDEITVSAVSGDKITLSTDQHLEIGQNLTFSKSAWEIGPITARMINSGTTAVTMSMEANVASIGIANITSACVVDSFVTVKPNAFPVTDVKCPAGSTVVINPIKECTNYLGQIGDNDANVGSKTYKIHSVPTDGTASRPTGDYDAEGSPTYGVLGFYGDSDVEADGAMGSAGSSSVTYAAHPNMVAGDKDFFYYKTVDAQSTPVASATDQGKISITIV